MTTGPKAEKGVRWRKAGGDDARPPGEMRLLTVRQAAEYLGTTPATLYTKVWRREIPFVKLGRSVRFDIRELEGLIEEATVKPQELSMRTETLGRET
jgi:excisionase family DNA binding protein